MKVTKYRKKPVVIEAVQYTEDNKYEICRWSGDTVWYGFPESVGKSAVALGYAPASDLWCSTLEGDLRASVGDVIKTLDARMGTSGNNVPVIVGPLTALGMANAKGTETVESHHYAHVGSTVRRLTPVECERLQSFPDGWTEFDVDGKRQSDSHRYKQMGNAVCVNVVEWIMGRLVTYEGREE